jgi:FAD:protein FMN transferase
LNANDNNYQYGLKPDRLAIHQRTRPMLGTLVSIRCETGDGVDGSRVVAAAFAAVARVDRLMHPTRVESDLAAIRAVGVGSIAIDPWTWEVLRCAREMHAASSGLFDPCAGDDVGCMHDVRLRPLSRVEIARRVAIDLGGIAKGFAVDRAIDELRDSGCSAGEVNAGGDLRVFGPVETEVWIRVGSARWPIRLSDSACAVSDASATNHPTEFRSYYRRDVADAGVSTGWAAVAAPSAMWADALATYAMACRNDAERAQFREVLIRYGARDLGPTATRAQAPPS